MQTLCGLDCCDKCSLLEECGGCCQTNGHPLGGSCVAAEVLARAGQEEVLRLQRAKMDEINGLGFPGLHVDTLNLVIGRFINLAYPLPGGDTARFLKDHRVYWANQIEIPGSEWCYGVVGDEEFLLVCRCSSRGQAPELLLYQQR